MARGIRITKEQWAKYIGILRKLQDKAADEMAAFMNRPEIQALSGNDYSQALIDYGYALATKYGEGATAVVCDWYDAIAMLEGLDLIPAVPAETVSYQEMAKTINGIRKTTESTEIISGAVGRWVKTVGVDTLMQNTLRDGAEWAWIPQGDTCAFCLTLASRGWQRASKNAIKNGHAEHIHANCDCTYAVRFSDNVDVEGYDPELYRKMYYDAPLKDGQSPSGKNRINAMRRQFYKENGTTEIEV